MSVSTQDPHFLEFTSLQRINILGLQNELARQKAEIAKTESVSDTQLLTLRLTLRDYATAIRDHEYLSSLAQISCSDRADRYNDLVHAFPTIGLQPSQPYNSRFCTFHPPASIPPDPLRTFLSHHLPRRVTWTRGEIERHTGEFTQNLPPEEISPFVDKLARLIIAFGTGASLVVPVVVMSLNKSVTKSLVTTSVAMLIFASALAFGMNASNTETLVATATYAAVLVVFVGASGP
ncbi:hypothetical protein EG329_009233 [Mollisiaceae sp. DMI_Dod_QoI]|nr:hypothetical protein EG329_009233 [Helotiales sp. DMI_Dod_QoI]